jgi:hypothetical protein
MPRVPSLQTVVQGVTGNAGIFFFEVRWPLAVLEPLSSNDLHHRAGL